MNTEKSKGKTVSEIMKDQGFTLKNGVWFNASGITLTPEEEDAIIKRAQRMASDTALGLPRKFTFRMPRRGRPKGR